MADDAAVATTVRIRNTVTLLEMAMDTSQALRRAQYVAEAQRQSGWALRSAVDECREAGTSWRTLASALGLAHDALYRQHLAGGPVVAGSAYYQSGSRNERKAFLVVIAFRTLDDGVLHVAADGAVRSLESFEQEFLSSNRSPYRGRILQYLYKRESGISEAKLGRSAGYTLRHSDQGIIASVTEEVFDELFGPPVIGSKRRREWESRIKD